MADSPKNCHSTDIWGHHYVLDTNAINKHKLIDFMVPWYSERNDNSSKKYFLIDSKRSCKFIILISLSRTNGIFSIFIEA